MADKDKRLSTQYDDDAGGAVVVLLMQCYVRICVS